MNIEKQKNRLILLSIVILILFTGCAKQNEIEQPVSETIAAEYEYAFNPHVITDEYIQVYGEVFKKEFFSLCDAILNVEDSFDCSSSERFYQLLSVSSSCFPLADELIDKNQTRVENGKCYLVYSFSKEETKEKITLFIDKVTGFIKESISYEEPDYVKAMELYTALLHKDSYDYSYTLEDSLDLRTYRAIMYDTGICQEIAREYIYYLLQIGIDALTCSSLNKEQSEAHEWVLIKLDGQYYHVDPTYGLNYPESLFFFGMDDIQRAYYGDFPVENYRYGETDLNGLSASDRRFEKFWLAKSYTIDHKNRKIEIIDNNTEQKFVYDFD